MIAYYLILAGEKFFPRKLPMFDALNLAGVIEPGEAMPSLDGKVYDYGRIRLSGDNLQALLQNARDILLSDGESIEDIEVNILYLYDSQCNLELSADSIREIADLGADLTISCDKIDQPA